VDGREEEVSVDSSVDDVEGVKNGADGASRAAGPDGGRKDAAMMAPEADPIGNREGVDDISSAEDSDGGQKDVTMNPKSDSTGHVPRAAAQMPPPRTKSQQLEHERVVRDAMVEYRCLASADDADNNSTSGSNEGSGAPNETLHTDARSNTVTAVETSSVRCERTEGCAATNTIVEQHERDAMNRAVDSGSSNSTRGR